MLDRREFLFASSLAALSFSGLVSSDGHSATPTGNLKSAAQKRGIEVGAFANIRQLLTPDFSQMLEANFTLVAVLFGEMEWGENPGFNSEPSFSALTRFLDVCAGLGLRTRARQIYSQENRPRNAHLRPDGTPKNKSELERTLLKRVEQVCKPLKGRNAIIQVIDEILADHEGGLRKDPFADALGEEYVDLLFHAAHEAAPDALLTYQEFGPEIDPDNFFKRKTWDYLALLERLRKRNVPITGVGLGGMGNYQLFIRWQRTKNFIIETDNLFNTGLYKIMIVEVCAVLIQPYPFLQGVLYKEEHMYGNNSNKFQVNDLLLCWMIFSRVYFYARSILSISFYTDPRSQRVCSIYGAEAGYTFALKALMKEKPWNVLACSLAMSVFVFGYCLRLFERVIQPEFTYVSTSMWNVLITMTTVGYGDYFA